MDIIIALLCFFGLMRYEDAGVTQQQVLNELNTKGVNTAEARVNRPLAGQMTIDRKED